MFEEDCMRDMDKKILKELAKSSQIQIEESELDFFFHSFKKLEKVIQDFSNLKFEKRIKPVENILSGTLNVNDLRKYRLNLFPSGLTKKDMEKNALIKNNKFILKKKSSLQ